MSGISLKKLEEYDTLFAERHTVIPSMELGELRKFHELLIEAIIAISKKIANYEKKLTKTRQNTFGIKHKIFQHFLHKRVNPPKRNSAIEEKIAWLDELRQTFEYYASDVNELIRDIEEEQSLANQLEEVIFPSNREEEVVTYYPLASSYHGDDLVKVVDKSWFPLKQITLGKGG